MHRSFLTTASVLLGLAVILGAFGAHGLKETISAQSLATYETGVRYHFYHGFALLATGILYERFNKKWLRFAGYCFIIGIVLFSGSLYLLAMLMRPDVVGIEKIGLITPFGGLFFIAGWIFLSLSPWRTA
jgi:uncharacterized membrane protein YgdD (TMEM256/DUF423 family)